MKKAKGMAWALKLSNGKLDIQTVYPQRRRVRGDKQALAGLRPETHKNSKVVKVEVREI